LLAQCGARARLQDFLAPWVALLRELPGAGVRWSLDVDPVDY
jgi:primosomal protein N'